MFKPFLELLFLGATNCKSEDKKTAFAAVQAKYEALEVLSDIVAKEVKPSLSNYQLTDDELQFVAKMVGERLAPAAKCSIKVSRTARDNNKVTISLTFNNNIFGG